MEDVSLGKLVKRALGDLMPTALENLARLREEIPDRYATLGVKEKATTDEIYDAYFAKIVKTLDSATLERAIATAVAERDRRAATVS